MHKNDRLRPWETALLAAVCVTLLTGVWAPAAAPRPRRGFSSGSLKWDAMG